MIGNILNEFSLSSWVKRVCKQPFPGVPSQLTKVPTGAFVIVALTEKTLPSLNTTETTPRPQQHHVTEEIRHWHSLNLKDGREESHLVELFPSSFGCPPWLVNTSTLRILWPVSPASLPSLSTSASLAVKSQRFTVCWRWAVTRGSWCGQVRGHC